MKLRKSLSLFLVALVICLVVMPGCGDSEDSSLKVGNSTPAANQVSNLPEVPDGVLGGNVRVSFDFRDETQGVATRERSQTPRDYILNSFLKEKIEEVELYLYLKNKVGEYEYYGYWDVPVVEGEGSDEKFLKAGDYRFETWTRSIYGQSFSSVRYQVIEPHTTNVVDLVFERTNWIVLPLCIVNPFGVYSEDEYYEVRDVRDFYLWDSQAHYTQGKLYFSVQICEPYDKSEIEFTVLAGTERIMHSFINIMDILSGNPISLQVTEVPTGTATISAAFEFENNPPAITIASPPQNGPAISASHFSLQGTAYPEELLQITMKNSEGVVLWDAPKVVDADGTFEIEVPLTKAPLTTTFTVTVEVGYENWKTFPSAVVDVVYQPPISITRDDSFSDATSEKPTQEEEHGLYNLGAYIIRVNRRFNASDFTASTVAPFPLGQHIESLCLVTRNGEFQVGHTVMYPSDDGTTPVAHLFHEDMVLDPGEYKFQLYADRKFGAPGSANFAFQLSVSGTISDLAEHFQTDPAVGQNVYLPAIN